jgi:hypothetical protein
LVEFSSRLEGIDNLDVSALEQDNNLIKNPLDQPQVLIAAQLFQSENQESHYATRGLGYMLKTFKGYHDFRCIQSLYSPPQPYKGFDLPLDPMCSIVKEDLSLEEKYTYSTEKICMNINQSSGEQTPYSYGDSDGTITAGACTDDNKCDMIKALPMMAALLWYKASAFIAQSLYYNSLKQLDTSSMKVKYNVIESMTRVVIAYASTV